MVITITENYQVLKMLPDQENQIAQIKTWSKSIKFFSFIHPICKHVVTINVDDTMIIYSTENEDIVSEVQLESISCFQEYTTLPIIGFGMTNGILLLISFFNVKTPKISRKFYLSHNQINFISFATHGTLTFVVDSLTNIFIIRGSFTEEMIVAQKIHLDYSVICFNVTNFDDENIFANILIKAEEEEKVRLIKYSNYNTLILNFKGTFNFFSIVDSCLWIKINQIKNFKEKPIAIHNN